MQTDSPEMPAAKLAATKKTHPSKATPIGRDISDAKLRALKPAEKAYRQAMGGDDRENSSDSASAQSRSGRPFVLKTATVFNADQVDGFHPEHVAPPAKQRQDMAEQVIKNSKAGILWGGEKACYLPTRDEIHLPHPEAFVSREAYYGVAFHELVHWTGHESRCARYLSGRFGSAAYAMEELVAELGAAFISGETGVVAEPHTDHAAYISSWLCCLKTAPKAIFKAASEASNAASFVLGSPSRLN